jgi:hypothetical protein
LRSVGTFKHAENRRYGWEKAGMNIQELAGLTDQEVVTGAVREMQVIARKLMQPGKRDTVRAVVELFEILDRNDVVKATERLSKHYLRAF